MMYRARNQQARCLDEGEVRCCLLLGKLEALVRSNVITDGYKEKKKEKEREGALALLLYLPRSPSHRR